jgi:hypothetical protein
MHDANILEGLRMAYVLADLANLIVCFNINARITRNSQKIFLSST